MKVRKFCQGCEIPAKIRKFNIDLFCSFIFQHFNYCIITGEFSNELKHAEVIPVQKKWINVIKVYEKISL